MTTNPTCPHCNIVLPSSEPQRYGLYKCPGCEGLLPLDYQHYFAALGMPVSYDLSQEVLDAALYARMQAVHPDQYHNNQAGQKELATQHASYINQAYQVLKNRHSRLEYLLKLRYPGFKEANLSAYLPENFLLTTMEWHDWLEASPTYDELRTKLREIVVLEEECYNRCAAAKIVDDGMLAAYAQIKFIQRFKGRIEQELENYE